MFWRGRRNTKRLQYKGYRISEIDPFSATVTFTNGEVISRGDVVGDISENDMRRIQIRETIILSDGELQSGATAN